MDDTEKPKRGDELGKCVPPTALRRNVSTAFIVRAVCFSQVLNKTYEATSNKRSESLPLSAY